MWRVSGMSKAWRVKHNVIIQNLARTRVCRECRAAKPVSGRYFAIIRAGSSDFMDVVCRVCRDWVGVRAWDGLHGNTANEPDDFK